MRINNMSEFEFPRNFQGMWIPAEIWTDSSLSLLEKALLAEIDSLDATERHCYASNEYFANFFQQTERTISKSIKNLIDLGYITQVSFDGRVRILKSNLTVAIENDEGVSSLPRKNFYADKNEEECLEENSSLPRKNFYSPTKNFLSINIDNSKKNKKEKPINNKDKEYNKESVLPINDTEDVFSKKKNSSDKKQQCLDMIEKEFDDERLQEVLKDIFQYGVM